MSILIIITKSGQDTSQWTDDARSYIPRAVLELVWLEPKWLRQKEKEKERERDEIYIET